MLTPEEERYLLTIPEETRVVVRAYDPRVATVAQHLIERILEADHEAQVLFMGASALEISGQNDIDLYVMSLQRDFSSHRASLESLFGTPAAVSENSIKWELVGHDWPVTVYLTDPTSAAMSRQLRVNAILKTDEAARQQYEELKWVARDLPLREYQRRKYEFYHQLLGEA